MFEQLSVVNFCKQHSGGRVTGSFTARSSEFSRATVFVDCRNWWISILSGWVLSRRIKSYRCGYASCSEMSLSCAGTSGSLARRPIQRAPCPYIRYEFCWVFIIKEMTFGWSNEDTMFLFIRGFHRKVLVTWWRLEMSELHPNSWFRLPEFSHIILFSSSWYISLH
jgi:hypothetical protein